MFQIPTLYNFEIIAHSVQIRSNKTYTKVGFAFRLFDYPSIIIYPRKTETDEFIWNVGKSCSIALTSA